MNIDKFQDAISACRFCFMCRHLSAVGNVSFRESDTPRGRALLAGILQRDGKAFHKDGVDAFYRSELSAANRFHCVSHYDENGLIIAARQDVVEMGLAPEAVKSLAKELAKTSFKVEGKGKILLALDAYSRKESLAALKKLCGGFATVADADAPKALKVLGFPKEAAKLAKDFAAAVKGFKTIVSNSPAVVDALKNDFKLDGAEVLTISEYLLSLKLKGSAKKQAYVLSSDFLRNYGGAAEAPASLLRSLGYELKPFGTNPEESYGVGEGAIVYDKVNPDLAAKLCARIKELADNPGKDMIVASSPYARAALAKYAPELKVVSIEEAAALAVKG
jgi:hypothetical protein